VHPVGVLLLLFANGHSPSPLSTVSWKEAGLTMVKVILAMWEGER